MATPTEVTECTRCGRPFRRRVTKSKPQRTCGDDACADRAKARKAEGADVL